MSKSKRYFVIIVFCIINSLFCVGDGSEIMNRYIPPDGFIPDEKTAKAIAEAIWIPIFGNKVKNNKPYIAKLENGIWYVKGSPVEILFLPVAGGEPYIEIDKMTGEILRVYHTK